MKAYPFGIGLGAALLLAGCNSVIPNGTTTPLPPTPPTVMPAPYVPAPVVPAPVAGVDGAVICQVADATNPPALLKAAGIKSPANAYTRLSTTTFVATSANVCKAVKGTVIVVTQ
jgi:hypothetical protein